MESKKQTHHLAVYGMDTFGNGKYQKIDDIKGYILKDMDNVKLDAEITSIIYPVLSTLLFADDDADTKIAVITVEPEAAGMRLMDGKPKRYKRFTTKGRHSQRVTVHTLDDSIDAKLKEVYGMKVLENLEDRYVIDAFDYQIDFLTCLEQDGMIMFGQKDDAPLPGKESISKSARAGDQKALMGASGGSDEMRASSRKAPNPQDHSLEYDAGKIKKEVKLSGVKVKYIGKLGLVEKIASKYKVSINSNKYGFVIMGDEPEDVKAAEKRMSEAIKDADGKETLPIHFKTEVKGSDRKAMQEMLQKADDDNEDMTYHIEDDGCIWLIGDYHNVATDLKHKFPVQLIFPSEFETQFLGGSGAASLSARSSVDVVDEKSMRVSHSPVSSGSSHSKMSDKSSKSKSSEEVMCDVNVFNYLMFAVKGFLYKIEKKHSVDITEDKLNKFMHLEIKGKEKIKVTAACKELRALVQEYEECIVVDKIAKVPAAVFKQRSGLMKRIEGIAKKRGTYLKYSDDTDEIILIANRKETCQKVKMEVNEELCSKSSPKADTDVPEVPARSRALPPIPGGTSPVTYRSKSSQLRVHVLLYDITRLKVDVIVNAANDGLMHGAGVAWAIAKAAGQQLIDESNQWISTYGRLKVGQVAPTTGGRLQCDAVLHAVGPMMADYRDRGSCLQALAKTVKNCLGFADHNKYTSIAIPAISSGIFGVKPADVARVMVSEISSYAERGQGTLTDIVLTDIIPEVVKLLQQAFEPQTDMEKLAAFKGEDLCLDKPGLFVPRAAAGHSGGYEGHSGSPGGHSAGYRRGSSDYKRGASDYAAKVAHGGSPGSYDYVKGRGSSGKPSAHAPGTGGSGSRHSAFGSDFKKGKQPINGSMKSNTTHMSLPGHERCKTIEITYTFQAGKQGSDGPSPGKDYIRDYRTAYLPDNTKGNIVHDLLKEAFKKRETFAVGINPQNGREGIIWNGIEHKTSTQRGMYGYPDPGYLDRVLRQLADRGIS